MAIKYLLLTKSYRRRLNFTLQGIKETGEKLEKIRGVIDSLKYANGIYDAEKISLKAMKKFQIAMDDNLDTGKALKAMEELSDAVSLIEPDKISSEKILKTFRSMDSILGLRLF
jgi:cysteinyl-tRNA synthetase